MTSDKNLTKLELKKIVPGGQTIADLILPDGQVKKVFVWGGLPGEKVAAQITKKRAGIYEAVVANVLTNSPNRIKPKDETSFLSTSPWQIMDWQFELEQKSALVQQMFAQHKLDVDPPEMITNHQEYQYRNKMEFTWWWDNEHQKLDMAHYRRGSKGKIPVDSSNLALPEINFAAQQIRDWLNRQQIEAFQLKTLLLRSNQRGQVVAQLYVKDRQIELPSIDLPTFGLRGFELIYSNPKSPASIITERLLELGDLTLTDQILDLQFSYPAESFFQINLPVYELALQEIKNNLLVDLLLVDLYSGVGTIGLSVADGRQLTLVEISPAAVVEMQNNISKQKIKDALAVLSAAESATNHITSDCQLIVDPPRAGLHKAVIERISEVKPPRIIYLSCNPVTQARDVALLSENYQIKNLKVFNFFPKTPHIESLVILDLI